MTTACCALVRKASLASTPGDAVQYSQAALNVAQAARLLWGGAAESGPAGDPEREVKRQDDCGGAGSARPDDTQAAEWCAAVDRLQRQRMAFQSECDTHALRMSALESCSWALARLGMLVRRPSWSSERWLTLL